MNTFLVMLRFDEESNLPKIGQFGKLLEFLSTHDGLAYPPTNADFNGGLNAVTIETKMCSQALEAECRKAGFEIIAGHTKTMGDCHDCVCQVAAE